MRTLRLRPRFRFERGKLERSRVGDDGTDVLFIRECITLCRRAAWTYFLHFLGTAFPSHAHSRCPHISFCLHRCSFHSFHGWSVHSNGTSLLPRLIPRGALSTAVLTTSLALSMPFPTCVWLSDYFSAYPCVVILWTPADHV